MGRTANTLAVLALLVGTVLGAGIVLAAVQPAAPGTGGDAATLPDSTPVTPAPGASLSASDASIGQFENRSAFRSYVAAGQRRKAGVAAVPSLSPGDDVVREMAGNDDETAAAEAADGDGSSAPSRIAGTNVQVGGLDEPDIVKTDGRHFYYAPQPRNIVAEPEPVDGDDREQPTRPTTRVIDTSDPAAPEAVGDIDATGTLLQTGDRLIVFERDRIAGYDVSDAAASTEVWSHPLDGSLVTARERNGTVYLVTESTATVGTDCPVEPLGEGHAVQCTDIYRPDAQVPVDATYTAFSIDADDGEVRDSVSFVGTSANSVVYMSPDALYVAYTQPADRAALAAAYVRDVMDGVPGHVKDRVAEIQSYDISPESKQREIRGAVVQWIRTLPEDRQESAWREYREGFAAYLADHKRELTTTGLVRVDVTDGALTVEATGTVPGEPLNQFSMDQHDGSLRIATTIPRTGDGGSENDLYTLDAESLDRRGAVTGMGADQRVYAVRYVGDTAYVVTFRQVDPLHVVDLSDPDDPVETGTLELPGFSTYLHPIDDDHVLGIGEENGRVKTVLFDVSNPSEPTIADSTLFDRRYSAVSETHHAFLIDRRHGVFVLPAGHRSLVVNYTDGRLTREATVTTDEVATRTRYVEDSLYVFAGDTVTVVDENSWTETSTLELGS